MIQNTMTFTAGEKLSAHKLNELVQMVNQQGSPTFTVPNKMGFKGDTRWGVADITLEQPSNRPRLKPFDIYAQWNANGDLTAYSIQRPIFYEDSTRHELSTQTIQHSGMGNVTSIELCEMSSSSTSQQTQKWRILDNTQISAYNNNQTEKVLNKWRIYDLDHGLVKTDYRDAFILLSLSGGSGEIDLSGTDNTHKKDDEFKFKSLTNSNVRVTISNNGEIQIGCYYV